MSLKTKKPGEYIRNLARKREKSAKMLYFQAKAVIIATLLLFLAFGISKIGILLLLAGLIGSYCLFRSGKHFEKRADDAKRGAQAETEVADILNISLSQRWQIEYNLKIKKWGDVDVVLHSPKDKWYAIDVKSHGGTKVYQNGKLRKRYGKNIYDFKEGDLIAKVKGQAKQVRRLKGAEWVIPMLCFTKSSIDISDDEISGVYVVTAADLVDTLLRLDK